MIENGYIDNVLNQNRAVKSDYDNLLNKLKTQFQNTIRGKSTDKLTIMT